MKRSMTGRVGWVRRNAGLIIESAHPLEKSATSFAATCIHRLSSAKVGVRWWGSGSVMGHFGGDVFLLKQVRFGYGYTEERIMGRTRE